MSPRRALLTLLAAFAALAGAAPLPGDDAWTATEAGRSALFELVAERVEALYWNPDHHDWRAWRERHRAAVVGAADAPALDRAFRAMFRDLGDEHSRWLGREGAASARPAPAAPPAGPDGPPALPEPSGPDVPTEPAEPVEAPPGGAPAPPPARAEGPTVERDPALAAARLAVPAFVPGTAEAVHDELARLAEEGVRALVLDLRGNPGGTVIEMGLVAGAFLDGAPLRSRGRGGEGWTLRVERGGRLAARLVRDGGPRAGSELAAGALAAPARWEGALAVLVDGGTASAAEALAGVLAAHGALVVGEATAGNVETIRRVAFPGGHAAMVAVGDLRLPDGAPLAPVRPALEVGGGAGNAPPGRDPAYAEAVRALRALPVTPGRWF